MAREESKRALVSAFNNPDANEDSQFSAQLQHFQAANPTAQKVKQNAKDAMRERAKAFL